MTNAFDAHDAATLTVLHLCEMRLDESDKAQWDSVQNAMASEFAELARMSRTIDLLVLSGGIGQNGEYRFVDELLSQVVDIGIDTGIFRDLPPIVPVPGDTDLRRQDGRSAAARTLHRLWPDIADEFWRESAPDELLLVQAAFAEYERWAIAHAAALPNRVSGLLPGDGSATLTYDGRRVGILTLNTCFRRLSDASATAEAVVGAPQLAAACGGDVAAWLSRHDFVVFVTFDSIERLDEESPQILQGLLAPGGPPLVQLCSPQAAVAGEKLKPAGLLALPGLPLELARKGAADETGFAIVTLRPRNDTVRVQRTPYVLAWSSGRATLRRGPVARYRVGSPPTMAPTTEEPESDSAAAAPQAHVRSEPVTVEPAVVRQLLRDLASGSMVLVLGSTSSFGLRNHKGDPLLTLGELRTRLTRLVIPHAATTDDELSMGELLAQARADNRQAVDELLRDGFTPVWDRPPARLSWLYDAPWEVAYDLGISTAPTKLASSDSMMTAVTVVDGVHDFTPPAFDRLQMVQVNGNAASPAEVCFDSPGSAQPISHRGQWLKRLAADLVSHPVVILADSPDDYELWAYVQFRAALDEQQNQNRPGGYFVCPDVGVTRRLRLPAYGLSWIPATVDDFVATYLAPQIAEVNQGRSVLARRRNIAAGGQGIKLMTGVLQSMQPGQKRFLLGQEPNWGDVHHGVAAPLSITAQLRLEIGNLEQPRTVTIVKGRAGTGKTASLMRLALDLHKEGLHVGWIDRFTERGRRNLEKEAEHLELDVVFVDNADIFGSTTTEFLERLRRKGATAVIASIRNTRYQALIAPLRGHRMFSHDFQLTDDDIRALIETLYAHGVPGKLREYKTPDSREEQFRMRSNRELLVGMMEVTRGKRFIKLIKDEYRDLPELEQLLFGTISFTMFTFESAYIYESELLQILGDRPPFTEWVASLRRLIDKNLVIRNDAGQVHTYHRAVADQIVTSVLKESPDDLARVCRETLGYFAASAHAVRDPRNRDRRLMIRLLSHSLMIDLRLSPDTVRGIYDSVRSWLQDDFHYWLQRGAYEVERGDLDLAENYLDQAKGCEGGKQDHFVLTEWGSMRLKQAVSALDSQTSIEFAMEAIETLVDVARLKQGDSPHTFAVLARDGSHWLSSNPAISDEERLDVARQIMEIIQLGRRECPGNREFITTARGAERKLRQILRSPERRRTSKEFPLL